MKRYKPGFTIVFFFMVLIPAATLAAMGSWENKQAYKDELEQEFDETIVELAAGKIDNRTAKEQLKNLRTKYSISYTDEAGILESIMDRTAERTMTPNEGHFYFQLLQEGKLMKFRQETYRKESEQYKRELVSLLAQKVEIPDINKTYTNELLDYLNNYYDMVGLEYDEEYFRLKEHILSLKNGLVTQEEILKTFDSMERQYIQNENIRSAQNNDRELQNSNQQKPGTASREPEAQSSDGNSEEKQKPQAGSSGQRR